MSRGGFFAVDSLSSVHVLVVDEDVSFREVLVSLLRYCGALVTALSTPEEALVAMNQVKPDVIVVTIGPDSAASSALPRRVPPAPPRPGPQARGRGQRADRGRAARSHGRHRSGGYERPSPRAAQS